MTIKAPAKIGVKATIEKKTNVTYDNNNMETSINKALQYLNGRLNDVKKALIAAKEKELVGRYNVNVTVEGRPEEDIAKTGIDIYKQIEASYSKVEQFIRETQVMNSMLVSDKTGSGQDIYRHVEKIWLYSVAGNNDNFLLTVVAKFKISALKPSVAKGESISRSQYSDMIYISAGTFKMGSNNGDNDEKPVHKVYVNNFYMDKYETTNGQYCKFLNEKGYQSEDGATWLDIKSEYCKIVKQGGRYVPVSGYANHPVIKVTWYGARAYAGWAGKRLPTEAEWEYAARGGNKSKGYKYSGSNNADLVAWYISNSGSKTHPVATKKPNEIGIYDMSGNVWEWCADWYDDNYYSKSPYENPTGPSNGKYRVLCGGSWINDRSYVRCSVRHSYYPADSNYGIGFRCAR
ncbi:MAG: SUMF1/EgtB/PvdO family nonheme iron enzyme [Actinobacteria bacterium]|nr:SUMF1/EgtB/PvdO family nonheme iron enzyme [Actinomycetota bacterium]